MDFLPSLTATLTAALKEAFISAFPALKLEANFSPELTLSTKEEFGHYQCNEAMKLKKKLNLNPQEIAQKVASSLPTNSPIAQVEIKGPGFINLWISPSYLAERLKKAFHSERLAIAQEKKDKVIVDFSSPNTAKEMHVGHLRSTIIGDSLAKIHTFLGYDVLRLNHIGDWGTSFGMLIAYLKKEHPALLSGAQETTLSDLVTWYRQAKAEFDRDEAFKRCSQQEVVSLQSGDPQALQAWEIICAISRKAYQEIYDLLSIDIIERGESFYNPWLKEVVADFQAKNLITKSDGALCVFLPGFQNREGQALPLIIQKSDGGYNYATTDLAAIKHRIQVEKAKKIIYVTDAGQETHFQMIFKAAELVGYLTPSEVHVHHVPFGLVLGTDGKKFRTRSGETEKLIDLLQNGIDAAFQIVSERHPTMPPLQQKELAQKLAIAAIKYADLSSHRQSDYVFSYERMLRFEGNTAIFLLYSYVRSLSIQRKSQKEIHWAPPSLQHPTEQALALKLLQFAEAIEASAKELLPNRLADYLYTLAEKFNAFFRDCRVEGSEFEQERLVLTHMVSRTLKLGLTLLGVPTVDAM